MMTCCSFGKISLRGLFEAEYPFGTELYARMLYLRQEDQEVLLVAMDTGDTFPAETTRFREGVARLTGIPADNIWYHELQAHAAPGSTLLQGKSMDNIVSAAAQEALALRQRAVPFTCRVAQADVDHRFSVNREQYVEGLGGVTIWTGMDFDEQGRGHTENPLIMLLRGYTPDLPALHQPIYFDNPVDPKAYLFVFSDSQGKVIGTLSRFAAHPDIGVLFESILFDHTDLNSKYHYDYDWPGTVSTRLEETFSAPSLYINGPCADLSTHKRHEGLDTYEKASAECRRVGNEIAQALLDQYEKGLCPLGEGPLKAIRFSVDLPIRDSLPHSLAELEEGHPARREAAQQALQQAIDQKESPAVIKKLIDNRWRVDVDYRFAHSVCGLTEENLKNRTVTVSVSALKLGDYLFVGVPGESLSDMGNWLRSAFTGVKTVPVDQVNGYYSYMATPASLTLGGYTYWSSWVSRESIPLLKKAILEKLTPFLAED